MAFDRHPRARIKDGALQFDSAGGWDAALARGLFYLDVPPGLDLAPGHRFCDSFHLPASGGPDAAYRGYRTRALEGTVLGYSNTGSDQVEKVQLELHLWDQFPAELARMLHTFNDLGRTIVRAFFDRCGVDRADVARITGGMETNEGLQYGIFNSFESRKTGADGFTPHKDSGFLQLMCVHEDGLEAFEDDRWSAVPPIPGTLTAILGHSLEVLTAKRTPRAAASYHRVQTTIRRPGERERTSFGTYIGPRFEQDLYQYDEAGVLQRFQSFEEFQRQKAREMGYEFHPALEVDKAPPPPPTQRSSAVQEAR